jgi:peptidoglycan/xylan/chitin deacetylase (PgdA/CDA1 family)
MRRRVGVFIAACFFYSGLVKLARWWRYRSGPHLIILTYHRASGGDLRRHLLYLRRHYRMLHLEEALEELYASAGVRRQGRDRRTPLVLTFDDGYHDNYTHAFTLARELKIPITIFLIPGYTENGAPFWWLQAKHLVHHAQVDKVMVEGRMYHLEKAEERALLAQTIDAHLRHARSVALRETFLAHIRQLLAGSSSVPAEAEAVSPLTWVEVREMDASGWVSFGAHTMHHPILAYLSSPEEVRREVEECRSVLEKRLGHRVRTFAYPLGRPEHMGEVALQAVRETGYDWAVTTIHSTNTPLSNPQQLRRLSGAVTRHWLVMAAETSGVWRFFSPLWKWRDSLASAKRD